jgi:AcrR family transcriptional regulator
MARDERRDQILAVAGHLFATLGYHHVAMDDIADDAGVGKPVLYRHFPSKLDLYLAVVDACGRDLLAGIDASVAALQTADEPGADGRDVVAAIARAYVSFVDVAGQATTLLFESDVTHDDDARARVGRASSEAAARIAAVLQQVAALSPDEARTASAAIVAMAQGAAIHRMRDDDAASAVATADLVARLAWACVDGLVAGTA